MTVCLFEPKQAESLLNTLTSMGIMIKPFTIREELSEDNVNLYADYYKTALHWLIERNTQTVDPKILLERIRRLIDYGNRIDDLDDNGLDALDYAITYNDKNAAEILMQMGAHILKRKKNLSDPQAAAGAGADSHFIKSSRLEFAIQARNLFMVEQILKAGYDLNSDQSILCALSVTRRNTDMSLRILELLLSQPTINLQLPQQPNEDLRPENLPENPTLLDYAMLENSELPQAAIDIVKRVVSSQMAKSLILFQANIQHWSKGPRQVQDTALLKDLSHCFKMNKPCLGISGGDAQTESWHKPGVDRNGKANASYEFCEDVMQPQNLVTNPLLEMYFFGFGNSIAAQTFIREEIARLCKAPQMLRLTDKECRGATKAPKLGSAGKESKLGEVHQHLQLQPQQTTAANDTASAVNGTVPTIGAVTAARGVVSDGAATTVRTNAASDGSAAPSLVFSSSIPGSLVTPESGLQSAVESSRVGTSGPPPSRNA